MNKKCKLAIAGVGFAAANGAAAPALISNTDFLSSLDFSSLSRGGGI